MHECLLFGHNKSPDDMAVNGALSLIHFRSCEIVAILDVRILQINEHSQGYPLALSPLNHSRRYFQQVYLTAPKFTYNITQHTVAVAHRV